MHQLTLADDCGSPGRCASLPKQHNLPTKAHRMMRCSREAPGSEGATSWQ